MSDYGDLFASALKGLILGAVIVGMFVGAITFGIIWLLVKFVF